MNLPSKRDSSIKLASFKMAAVDKGVLGLLNGLAKREYYNEEDITNEFLHEQLFPDLDDSSFNVCLQKFDNIMRTMVNSDMDFRQLEAFLTSQMKRREGAIEEKQAAAISRFWKNHKSKIHDVMVDRSTFGNRLKQANWRIDLKTQGRHVDGINTPVAIYELEIDSNKGFNTEKLRFEMDAEQLDDVLGKVQKIKEKIGAIANG